MPFGDVLALMRFAYGVAATGVILVASGVLIRLFAIWARGRSRSPRLLVQECIWTLVPVLVVAGLTVLNRIPPAKMALGVAPIGAPLHQQSR